jgi:hypothetical protein
MTPADSSRSATPSARNCYPCLGMKCYRCLRNRPKHSPTRSLCSNLSESLRLDRTSAVAILLRSHRERVMANNACPSCGVVGLRALPSLDGFSAVAYFRCPSCTQVWCIRRDDGASVRRITGVSSGEKPDEDALLFTCPHCSAPLYFDGVRGEDGSRVMFFCRTHGFFRFTNDEGLVATL